MWQCFLVLSWWLSSSSSSSSSSCPLSHCLCQPCTSCSQCNVGNKDTIWPFWQLPSWQGKAQLCNKEWMNEMEKERRNESKYAPLAIPSFEILLCLWPPYQHMHLCVVWWDEVEDYESILVFYPVIGVYWWWGRSWKGSRVGGWKEGRGWVGEGEEKTISQDIRSWRGSRDEMGMDMEGSKERQGNTGSISTGI